MGFPRHLPEYHPCGPRPGCTSNSKLQGGWKSLLYLGRERGREKGTRRFHSRGCGNSYDKVGFFDGPEQSTYTEDDPVAWSCPQWWLSETEFIPLSYCSTLHIPTIHMCFVSELSPADGLRAPTDPSTAQLFQILALYHNDNTSNNEAHRSCFILLEYIL